MKKILPLALTLSAVLMARGQPLVNFNNRLSDVFSAPVYGVDQCFLHTQIRAESDFFDGPLVSGSGYAAELWGGPLGSTEDSLALLGSTTFRSNASAGFLVAVQVPVLSIPSGERATFQVRAWDNRAGTVIAWNQAQTNEIGAYGSSALFSPPDPLGDSPLNLVGLTSFNLIAPRPTPNGLGRVGGPGHIAWINSPAFQFPGVPDMAAPLDLDRDGAPDFAFAWSRPNCTASFPMSWCRAPFHASALGANAVMAQSSGVWVMPIGTSIGSLAPSNAVWSNPGQGLELTMYRTVYDASLHFGIAGWCPPLGVAEAGYIGVRFQASDGWHYGWIYVRLPNTNNMETTPVITDWAYETRPEVAILSGAIPVIAPLATPHIVRPGHLRVRWMSEVGKAYQVQLKDHVEAPRWTNLEFVLVATATESAVDVPLVGPARFFRVVEAD